MEIIDDKEPIFNELSIDNNQKNQKGYVPIRLNVEDDRKIMRTVAKITTDNDDFESSIEVAVRNVQSYESTKYLDFTGSDYAGSNVDLVISIEDEAGQTTTKQLDDVQLPIKEYKNPLAQKLISLYEQLENPQGKLRSSAREIKALGLLSEGENLPAIYYMALRSAYWRLINPTELNDRKVARGLLWGVAQKI